MVSISGDSSQQLFNDSQRLGLQSPLLSDPQGNTARTYGIPLTFGGEPGHAFVLVGPDGIVEWAKDYADSSQGPVLMYVEVEKLYREVSTKITLRKSP